MTSSSTAPCSVWFSAPGVVELRHEAPADLGSADVRIDALASAISHGTEMLVLRGQVPAGLELDLPTLRGGFEFPIKYGYASVGRVVEAGSDATLEPGQAVFVHHPHQSSYVVPSTLAVPLPEELDPLLGVFLANLETAINIVLDAAPRFGERVAIFGQGVVGLLVTQLVRRAGASTIIVVEPLPARRELAMRLGADQALAPVETAESVIRELTEGSGVDVAIEVSGNVAALQQALDSLAFGGTAVVCSWYGTKPVALHLGGGFHRRRPRILSSQVSSIDGALQPRWSHRRRLRLALDLLPKLDLVSLISHRVPLEQAREAYALVDRHPEQSVQVVLTYG
jgi:2-desacetyl-2-hydroxyethyl bacteriochlorophyllide A dehydrogenase